MRLSEERSLSVLCVREGDSELERGSDSYTQLLVNSTSGLIASGS